MTILGSGNVGIGIATPKNFLHIDGGSAAVYTQYTTTTTGNTGATTSGFIVGVDGSGNAILKSNYTSGSNGEMRFSTAGSQAMVITNSGDIGIGTPTPGELLTVTGGNIKIGTGNKKYMIGSDAVLWHNNKPTNIMVGVDAGNSSMSGLYNTLVGSTAGNIVTTGQKNSMVGYGAGSGVTTGYENVIIGYNSGTAVTSGFANVILGYNAASAHTSGFSNVFVGESSGSSNVTGQDNVCVGAHSGTVNSAVIGAVAIGEGSKAQADYSVAIGKGANALVASTMILGNNIKVGIGLSSDATGPTNKLEIKAGTDLSGLTFTNLKSTATTNFLSWFGKVLTVSSTGIVGLTDDAGFTDANNGLSKDPNNDRQVQLGHELGVGINGDLVHDTEIPMVNFNLVFTDAASVNGAGNSIGIGTTTPLGKLSINRNLSATPVYNPTAVYVENTDEDIHNFISTGIDNRTYGSNEYNIGISSLVFNGLNNTAGMFIANEPTEYTNIGGYFEADYAAYNFGVYGIAPGFSPDGGSIFNVGVYGDAPTNGAYPFPGLGSGSYAGYFNGDLAYTDFFGSVSDSTIKTNIQLFKNASSILNQINCYTFNFDTTKVGKHVHLPKGMQYGVLAQQVMQAAPGLVKNGDLPPELDSLGKIVTPAQPIKIVDYVKMVPLLLEGYHEQQTLIDSLTIRLSDLETLVSSCCAGNRANNNPGATGQNDPINVKLQNADMAILYQNEPNPYTNATSIRYFIPENATNAKITFQDNTGKTLKEVNLTSKGQGSLQVDGSELINGIYTYSLVISGKTVDTKKMVKAE